MSEIVADLTDDGMLQLNIALEFTRDYLDYYFVLNSHHKRHCYLTLKQTTCYRPLYGQSVA
jgi:hypothetical protein